MGTAVTVIVNTTNEITTRTRNAKFFILEPSQLRNQITKLNAIGMPHSEHPYISTNMCDSLITRENFLIDVGASMHQIRPTAMGTKDTAKVKLEQCSERLIKN